MNYEQKKANLEWARGVFERASRAPWKADTRQPDDVVIWGPRELPDADSATFVGNVGDWRTRGPYAAMPASHMDGIDAANAAVIVLGRNVGLQLLDLAKALTRADHQGWGDQHPEVNGSLDLFHATLADARKRSEEP